MPRGSRGNAEEPCSVVADSLPVTHRKLAECGGAESVGLRVSRPPTVPFRDLSESLQAVLQTRLPAILGLPLVAELRVGLAGCLEAPLDQEVKVELESREFRLEQRTDAHFVSFASILRALEFYDEAEVQWVLAGFGDLEFVFPLPGVEAKACALQAVVFAVDLGKPALRDSVAESQRPRALARFIGIARRTGFELQFAFAIGNRRQEDIV